LRPKRFQTEVPVNADEANQHPENFHQESREIEVEKQGDNDKARTRGVPGVFSVS
jgi:hypothetical protein